MIDKQEHSNQQLATSPKKIINLNGFVLPNTEKCDPAKVWPSRVLDIHKLLSLFYKTISRPGDLV